MLQLFLLLEKVNIFELFSSSFTSTTISRLIGINNQAFGGNRPNVTKVYFTHGELDPYRSVGVLEPFADEIYVDIIPSELFSVP